MATIKYLKETIDDCKVNIVCKCGKSYTVIVKSGNSLKCKCGIIYRAYYTGWVVSESAIKTEIGNTIQLQDIDEDDVPF